MQEQHPTSPTAPGAELLRQMLHLHNSELLDTYGRHNLATTDESFDVLQLAGGIPQKRFLVVTAAATVGAIETSLDEARIPTLALAALVDGHAIYEVPIGAKPLAEERFFPDRESTETYISDEELCATLGKLWGKIYRATCRLPIAAPLEHTGMLEFAGKDAKLFPIPPYDWARPTDSGAAKEHFLGTMSEELLAPGSAAGDYERLLEAASKSWEES